MTTKEPARQRAATIIVEIATEQGPFLVLAAVDPRWRIDREGRYAGAPALLDGALTSLPLTGLKFVGGLVDEGEQPLDAALRELGEEAGAGIGKAVREAGAREVYRMTRDLEWSPGARIEISYFHTRIEARLDDLAGLVEPADDCLAIVLVRPAQVTLGDDGYAVTGAAAATFWRKEFVSVPYEGWATTQAQRAAFEAYNAAGREDPYAGIDRASLRALRVALFCPRDASPTDSMRDDDPKTGRPLPDGAVLAHAIGGL